MAHYRLAALVAAAASSAAWGQGINIDFGDGFGVPPPKYAAAGTPGTWNAVAGDPDVPQPLVGLDGQPLAATVTLMNFAGGIDDPATTGANEQLFDDGLFGLGDVVSFLDFDGLANGSYGLIVYAWTPTIATDFTTVMIGEGFDPSLMAGGPWPGGLEEGVTHVAVDVEVTEGTLRIGFVGNIVATSGFLNGIQLWPNAEGDPGDLDDDGCVGPIDLTILLTGWTGGHGCDGVNEHSCDEDINEDGVVDILDLIKLLTSWSC
ncbi:MAG: hypothetical protein ACYSTY_10665 [Planctomycetota bacterium]|jgi:hypothetical protein